MQHKLAKHGETMPFCLDDALGGSLMWQLFTDRVVLENMLRCKKR